MLITADSHLDHGLSPSHISFLSGLFAGRDAFFIETVTLPDDLGPVPCALFGPIMGDAPITEARMECRGTREYTSRVIVSSPRMVRTVTVIAGPHNGLPCILYTAFGGALSPKEPNDPTLAPDKREESEAFWKVHALGV